MRESSWLRKFWKKQGENILGRFLIWLFTWTDLFFGPGYTPPHCLAGRHYHCTYRSSGDMNCPSQFFSIPLRYIVRFLSSMARAQYLGSTYSTRGSVWTLMRCPVQVRSSTALSRKFMGAKICEKVKANKIGSVPNMTHYMDRPFFLHGVHSPPLPRRPLLF